jgi:uncharacterized protein YdaU (DUF1376 family)
MAAIPFMPLYVADYLSDAAHLSTIEHGAYLLLIMTYWQRGEPLPDDDKKLARICKLTSSQWRRVKPTILEFFETDNDNAVGQLRHSRIERELSNVRAKSLKKRKGGLARAEQMLSERSARAQRSDTDTDTDTVVPFPNGKGAEADSDTAFWDNAKAYLGKPKSSLIGKWVRDYGQAETARAITAAQIARAVDPVPYIERALRGGSQAYPEGHSGVPL